ncbi:MAG: hypothetical protein V1748_09960 [Actinomycetota bacterium]
MEQTGRNKSRPDEIAPKSDVVKDTRPAVNERASTGNYSPRETTVLNPYREMAILLLDACDGVIDLDIDDKRITE